MEPAAATTLANDIPKRNSNSTMKVYKDSLSCCQGKIKLFKLLVILISILVSLKPVDCQQSALNNTTSTNTDAHTSKDTSNNSSSSNSGRTGEEINGRSTSEENILSPSGGTTVAPASELLLSVSEFVDFTERPTFLFDGISNETNDTKPGAAVAAAEQPTTSVNKTTADSTITVEPRDSRVPTRLEFANAAAEANATAATTTTTTPTATTTNSTAGDESGEYSDSDDGNEEDEPGDSDLHESSRIFTPPQNVSQYMDYIEGLVHDFRHQITGLFEPHLPKWIRTSQMVQLSNSCSYDMLRLALALRKFEPWALRMIDSSGKLPEGIFEGSFTSLGSYDECLNIAFDPSMTTSHQSGNGNNHQALQQTQGKYCLVNVSPFLPPKPPADKVERMFQEEANRRNYAKDDQFFRLSPMFYYMKFRIGVCIPSTCLDSDMEAVASTLSSTLRLNITIPDCRVKEAYHKLTGAELAGGIVFCFVLSAVLFATLFDSWRQKSARMRQQESAAMLQGCQLVSARDQQSCKLSAAARQADLSLAHKIQWLPSASPASQPKQGGAEASIGPRLDKHWSWRSFSLLTNYKLYFENKSSTLVSKRERPEARSCGCQRGGTDITGNKEGLASNKHQLSALAPATNRLMLVRCLDGIRVLSLCWVIVANSYITLDPRATKRLTKTREAPKDFLFQMIVQASLAIETFFFLSGVLMSLSFARRLKPDKLPPSTADADSEGPAPEVRVVVGGKVISTSNGRHEQLGLGGVSSAASLRESRGQLELAPSTIRWLQFYVHRYIRVTPATMLVIAFAMFAYSYGDGPLWFEATHKAHLSCGENWWRHLLHVANFIDTRQMCFIHYWYVAADMQLFLFAPILLLLIYKRRKLGYALATLLGLLSVGSVFYTTYIRNLPPTLLFYSSDPESRREFGNTIMTKPLTHALPYMVGMLLGKWLAGDRQLPNDHDDDDGQNDDRQHHHHSNRRRETSARSIVATLVGFLACLVALGEVFLPYKWNNSQLPTRFLAALYAALFRFAWSLVLACLVVSCRHKRDYRCLRARQQLIGRAKLTAAAATSRRQHTGGSCCSCPSNCCHSKQLQSSRNNDEQRDANSTDTLAMQAHPATREFADNQPQWCFCGAAGSLLNRFLSLNIFTHLSKLSFVAYLIHLPLMSVFVAQTRGLFAFSHTLVIHLALSYLVMTFALSFVLVHIIEFPFITFEVHFFERLLGYFVAGRNRKAKQQRQQQPQPQQQW